MRSTSATLIQLVAAALAAATAACGSGEGSAPDDTDTDTAADTDGGGTDTGDDSDAGTDAGPDVDAVTDTDAGQDTDPDATPDADAAPDADPDADAGPDADPCLACDPTATCDPTAAQPCQCPEASFGDGTFCEQPVEIAAFAFDGFVGYRGSPASFDVNVRNAQQCVITADYVGELATLDADALAEPTTFVVDDASTLVDPVLAATASPQVVLRMTCTGRDPENSVSAIAPLFVAAFAPFPVEVTPLSVAAGDPTEVCWEAPAEFDTCRVSAIALDESGSEQVRDQPSTGCATLTLGADSNIVVRCEDSETGARRLATAVGLVDGGPATVVATPAVFGPDGGTATVTWTSEGATDCSLTYRGAEIATDLNGTQEVAIAPTDWTASEREFALTCDGTTIRTYVYVPGVDPIYLNEIDGGLSYDVTFGQTLLPFCDIEVRRGDEIVLAEIVEGNSYGTATMGGPAPTDEDYVVEVTVTCDGLLGSATRTEVFDFGYTRITELSVTPDALPSIGGEVLICWAAANAETCYMTSTLGELDGELPGVEGCVTATVPRYGEHYVRVECLSGDLESADSQHLDLPRGPRIVDFSVTPEVLAEPGVVVANYLVNGATHCDLFTPDPVGVNPVSSSEAFSVSEDTWVQLVCADDEGGDSVIRAQNVWVGWSIRDFAFFYAQTDELYGYWAVPPGSDCTITLENNGEPLAPYYQQPSDLGVMVPWSTLDFVATLSCTFGDGTTEEQTIAMGPPTPEITASRSGRIARVCGASPGYGYCVASDEGGVDYPFDSEGCYEFPSSNGWTSDWTCYTVDAIPIVGGTVEVPAFVPPVPTIDSFVATPGRVPAVGGLVEACWSTTDATGCSLATLDPDFGVQEVPVDGCVNILLADAAQRLPTLTCTNDDAPTLAVAELDVEVGVTIDRFDASQVVLPSAGDVELTWSTTAAVGCTLYGPFGAEPVDVSGSRWVIVSNDATFTLTCSDGTTGPDTVAVVDVFVGGGVRDVQTHYAAADAVRVSYIPLPGATCTPTLDLGATTPTTVSPSGFSLVTDLSTLNVEVSIVCTIGGFEVDRVNLLLAPPQLSTALFPDASGTTFCWSAGFHTYCDLRAVTVGIDLPSLPTESCYAFSEPTPFQFTTTCYAEDGAAISSVTETYLPPT